MLRLKVPARAVALRQPNRGGTKELGTALMFLRYSADTHLRGFTVMMNPRTNGALALKADTIQTLGLTRYGTLRDKAEALYRKGVTELDAGRLEDAVKSLREAVLVFPAHAGAWNDLGVVMEVLENHSDAMACYRAALRCRPDHAEARSNLKMLVMARDLERALRLDRTFTQPVTSTLTV